MSCVKCGNETENGQVFCAHCLEQMEAYPIKPDAHVQLPARATEAEPKKQRRKWRPARKDAQIANLQRKIRWMWVVIFALALALAISVGKTVRDAVNPKDAETGQNYTYIEPTT